MNLPLGLALVATCVACQTRDVGSADSANAAADSADAVRLAAPGRASFALADGPVGRPTGRDSAVEYYPAALLAHVGDSVARGSTTAHTLRTHPTYQYVQVRRNRSGTPEVHDRWTDVTMVQAGRATLVTGGRVTGSHVEAPGEHRGGTIAGGASRAVGPGDLMIIPAGIPHQYVISPGDSLRYLTVKVSRPNGGY